MKVTINKVKPTPPPKTYTLELSQEEMDLIREIIKYPTLAAESPSRREAVNRFLNLTSSCSGNTCKPDVCFKDSK